jgi:DNA-binding response OmpR family regulator
VLEASARSGGSPQNVFESGADQFVAKPFRNPDLLDSVREMLRPA